MIIKTAMKEIINGNPKIQYGLILIVGIDEGIEIESSQSLTSSDHSSLSSEAVANDKNNKAAGAKVV